MDTSTVLPNNDTAPAADAALFEEMIKAGILYGRSKSKTNPKMKDYILTTRSGMEIFDLTQTLAALDRAKEFIKSSQEKKLKFLLVATQPTLKCLIRQWAEKLEAPYVVERWLGGTITNFQVLSKRLHYYLKLKADRAAGKLDKYTKKERLNFDREIARMEKLFGGLEKLDKLPDVLFIVDVGLKNHQTAIREAKRLKIPIVAVVNTDNDPAINYPIPANTASKNGVEWLMNRLFS